MDELMEVSFSPIAATGKPLSRCGKCHRFMKYIQVSKPKAFFTSDGTRCTLYLLLLVCHCAKVLKIVKKKLYFSTISDASNGPLVHHGL